jgi:tetratricopeptide (TPR) repeat protein
LQDRQQQLRSAEVQDQASTLFEKGVSNYKEGQYQVSLETFREAERLLPQDSAIKEVRRKLEGITPIIEKEEGGTLGGELIRVAITRYLDNDPKRALNALIYASEKVNDRREIPRLLQLVESNHPEVEPPRLTAGIMLVDHKLQLALEAIYDGRYLSAISECTEVLDIEPKNVLAMTRLGSAYYAMNEMNKAKQVWTRALQLDPNNDVLRKFLYGKQGSSRVEATRK